MRILFKLPYPDPYLPGRVYEPGWVAEFTDTDGQNAIDAGAAVPAPEGAFSRKGAAPSFECAAPPSPPGGGENALSGVFRKTGEKMSLKSLTNK